MSYDVSIIPPVCDSCGCAGRNTLDINGTYNYQPAIAAAGLDSISQLHGYPTEKVAEVLGPVLTNLIAHPEYADLIKGNRTWGTRETMLEFLSEILDAARTTPGGRVHVT